ncbi:MAG: helix-turn-helix transcriptional regulator [Desulfuromusa sp.]|nr:helix-turn-helix transcriptional regulator [Desulfuromusa sp.]
MLPLPSFAFATFVGWLLLFPMGGLPVAGIDISSPLLNFLFPHAVSLVLIGYFCSSRRFARLSLIATLVTIGLTCLYPLVPTAAPILLPLLGICSAFLSIRACILLRQSARPLLQAGVGLVLGNLIVLVGLLTPVPTQIKFIFLALMPLLSLLPLEEKILSDKKNQGIFRYLFFVFIYQLVSGIMYGGIMPAFSEIGIGRGSELVFYIAAVLCGIVLFRINREYLLAAGVLLAMTSLACFLGHSPWSITLSMYAMQAAAGCLDIFILGYLFSFDNPLAAFGIGNGTVCLSIFCGYQLAVWIGAPSTSLVMAGCLILTCSIFALYFLSQKNSSPIDNREAGSPTALPPTNDTPDTIPAQSIVLAKMILSSRELEVFCCVLAGKTYKVAATELQLSESTVKTYMKRIFNKYNVTCKQELINKIQQA